MVFDNHGLRENPLGVTGGSVAREALNPTRNWHQTKETYAILQSRSSIRSTGPRACIHQGDTTEILLVISSVTENHANNDFLNALNVGAIDRRFSDKRQFTTTLARFGHQKNTTDSRAGSDRHRPR
ncbi:hypothetical protein N9B39_00245 [bacterium]|nr:hypothetical protein [Rubripirellula sp.]MDA7877954.1 hypothetical protein [bacterium]MDB4561696.1 hypothetical protein [bacterium]MDB4625065.1 hypothetical protein [Rubripirellula sp.]